MQSLIFPILILATVVLNTAAQALLKAGTGGASLLNPYLIGGICTYGLSTIFYILVLGKFNLSVAYPIIIGLTVVATTVAGAVIFKERITMVQWLGIGLMFSAVSAIGFGKIS